MSAHYGLSHHLVWGNLYVIAFPNRSGTLLVTAFINIISRFQEYSIVAWESLLNLAVSDKGEKKGIKMTCF